MTVAICPTRHPPQATKKFLDSFLACDPRPERLIMVVDDRPNTAAMLAELDDPRVEVVVNAENIGYFPSVNRGLELVEDDKEPFCYLQVDLEFQGDWYAQAAAFFARTYPDGLGLISFRDGIQDGTNASQGATTKRWLWVVLGEPHFPGAYFRHFGDSELTARSKELGRYAYCPKAVTPHHWKPVESNPKFQPNDFWAQNQRYAEWRQGGFEAAQERLAKLNPLPSAPEAPQPDPEHAVIVPTVSVPLLGALLAGKVRLAYKRHNTAAIQFKGMSGAVYEGADTDLLRFADVEPGDAERLVASGAWRRAGE